MIRFLTWLGHLIEGDRNEAISSDIRVRQGDYVNLPFLSTLTEWQGSALAQLEIFEPRAEREAA